MANPFKGMTMAQMKKKYSSMTPEQRGKTAGDFVRAAKVAPKAKPPVKAKPPATTSRSSGKGSGKGTSGKSLPSNPQLKTQTKATTGQSPVKKNLYAPNKMVGEDVQPTRKGASSSRKTGSNVSKTKKVKSKKEMPKYNRRGRRI